MKIHSSLGGAGLQGHLHKAFDSHASAEKPDRRSYAGNVPFGPSGYPLPAPTTRAHLLVPVRAGVRFCSEAPLRHSIYVLEGS
jgi:hypothetical protein